MSQTARSNARALPIGKARRLALASETDAWINQLFNNAVTEPEKYALVAIGGYGRSELTLGSDLDLLLLHENGSKVDKLAEAIWYPIWNENIKLDHSVRTISQTRALAANELAVFLGLLDARCVAGNQELIQSLKLTILSDWRTMAKKRLFELKEEVEKRKNNFGQLPHLIEPNLKESYGGLREAVTIRAIAASWITDVDHTNLDNSVELLLDVRDALHQVTDSSNDILVRQEQAEIAKILGYPNSETLLRSVAKAAKSIAHLSDVAWYRVMAMHQRTSFLSKLRKSERTPLADGVVVENKEVYLAKEANLRNDPNLLLRAAAASAQAGLIFSPSILERFKYGITEIEFPLDQEARDSLVSLLGSGRFLLTTWDALDENELIDKFLPIWQRVRNLPQSSPVHIWTVDRHLLEAVMHAVELSRGVSRPDLLFVGCLLHDIGKGELTDHTLVGMEIVQEVVPQLGFDEADTEIIVRLIEHHLLLAETATKRDLNDQATIDFVKEKVKTQEFLDLLYALTLADAAATGPLVNTDWRKHLLDQLYEKVKLEIQTQPKNDYQQLIIDLEKYYDQNIKFSLSVEIKKPATEIVVVSEDHPRLLAQIAAALSFHRLEIKSARTKTIKNQAITTWLVSPEFGDFPDTKILELDLKNALSGHVNIFEKLNTRASFQKIPFDTPPAVITEVVDINSKQTLIEVRAHNQSGLLAKLAATISELNVLIQAAIVQTLGSEVVDVFYVTELNEDKLSAERVAELIKALDYACAYVRPTI